MALSVVMPQMGLEVTEGVVTTILVEVGAQVSEGEPVVELTTDKADTDVEAPRDGFVRAIRVSVGDAVNVGQELLVLTQTADEPLAGSAPDANGDRRIIRAAPVARRAAAKLGVTLEEVEGTGPRGRITLRDVESAAAPATGAHSPDALVEELSPLRRAIARRMTASQLIPQYQLVREIDATELLHRKDVLRGGDGRRVGLNDLLIQALAATVVRHPDLGAALVTGEDDEQPRLARRAGVNVGLAVATERGLVVPVVKRADELTLTEIAQERARLVDAARGGVLSLGEMSEGTITLSNLGSFGVDRFTAMVNPGETSILAVGRVVEKLVPRGRTIAVVPTLTLTMSLDHRVVDGAAGAHALDFLVNLLEGGTHWRV